MSLLSQRIPIRLPSMKTTMAVSCVCARRFSSKTNNSPCGSDLRTPGKHGNGFCPPRRYHPSRQEVAGSRRKARFNPGVGNYLTNQLLSPQPRQWGPSQNHTIPSASTSRARFFMLAVDDFATVNAPKTAEIEQCLCGSTAPDLLGHSQLLNQSTCKLL